MARGRLTQLRLRLRSPRRLSPWPRCCARLQTSTSWSSTWWPTASSPPARLRSSNLTRGRAIRRTSSRPRTANATSSASSRRATSSKGRTTWAESTRSLPRLRARMSRSRALCFSVTMPTSSELCVSISVQSVSISVQNPSFSAPNPSFQARIPACLAQTCTHLPRCW